MKILKVELNQDEQEQILKKLIEKFNPDTDKKQEVNFYLNDTVEIWAELTLESEGYIEPETNSVVITSRYVDRFKIYYTIDGEEIDPEFSEVSYKSEIDGLFYTKRGECIEELISKNYSI